MVKGEGGWVDRFVNRKAQRFGKKKRKKEKRKGKKEREIKRVEIKLSTRYRPAIFISYTSSISLERMFFRERKRRGWKKKRRRINIFNFHAIISISEKRKDGM